ncbi:MAG: hypothetical protein HKN21_12965 [Candidatus Eisenbacteria bacterium]|uniref:LamG domain-containing protein n=1 Tax=Eiseniibacteriota bacterium TaxID=2212470 RepID=A0A7Y2E9F4_UNCEI|nr:hypothetical protein [Candidatus Eisenbacteria bacterium]
MPRLFIGLTLLLSASPLFAQPFEANWEATSEELPSQSCRYNVIDTSPTNPNLNPEFLTLSTPNNNQFLGYEHLSGHLQVPSMLVVEARIRFNSGSSSQSNQTGCGIVIEPIPDQTTILYLEDGAIFLLADPNTRGAQSAIPTSDGFHTYRIEVQRDTGVVQVFYDDKLTLEGTTYAFTASDGLPSIYWGDPANAARADSDWMWFRHNAATLACGNLTPVSSTTWGKLKRTP